MPQFTSDYNFDTGQLNAAQQGDALAGMEGVGGGGGADFGGLVGTILGERRRKEQMALAEQRRQEQLQERARQRQEALMRDQQRQAQMERQRQEAMARDEPFQRLRTAKGLERGFRQDNNLSRLIGGPQASHFQDYAARMAGMQAAGVPIYDYTGIKDIVAGNAGASQAAVGEAGANLRQRREQQFNASPAGLQYAALNSRR